MNFFLFTIFIFTLLHFHGLVSFNVYFLVFLLSMSEVKRKAIKNKLKL